MGRVCKCCKDTEECSDRCSCVDLIQEFEYDYLLTICIHPDLPQNFFTENCQDYEIYISNPAPSNPWYRPGSSLFLGGDNELTRCEARFPERSACFVDDESYNYLGELICNEEKPCSTAIFATDSSMLSDVRSLCDDATDNFVRCCYSSQVDVITIPYSIFDNGCDKASYLCDPNARHGITEPTFSNCLKIVKKSTTISSARNLLVQLWRKNKQNGDICLLFHKVVSGFGDSVIKEQISQSCCFCECSRPSSGLGQGPLPTPLRSRTLSYSDISDTYSENQTQEVTRKDYFVTLPECESLTDSYTTITSNLILSGFSQVNGTYESVSLSSLRPRRGVVSCCPKLTHDILDGVIPGNLRILPKNYFDCDIVSCERNRCNDNHLLDRCCFHLIEVPLVPVSGTFDFSFDFKYFNRYNRKLCCCPIPYCACLIGSREDIMRINYSYRIKGWVPPPTPDNYLYYNFDFTAALYFELVSYNYFRSIEELCLSDLYYPQQYGDYVCPPPNPRLYTSTTYGFDDVPEDKRCLSGSINPLFRTSGDIYQGNQGNCRCRSLSSCDADFLNPFSSVFGPCTIFGRSFTTTMGYSGCWAESYDPTQFVGSTSNSGPLNCAGFANNVIDNYFATSVWNEGPVCGQPKILTESRERILPECNLNLDYTSPDGGIAIKRTFYSPEFRAKSTGTAIYA